jgi:hypothetical protein
LVYLVYFYIFYPKSSKFTALELTRESSMISVRDLNAILRYASIINK